jgi:hypothetical protein
LKESPKTEKDPIEFNEIKRGKKLPSLLTCADRFRMQYLCCPVSADTKY